MSVRMYVGGISFDMNDDGLRGMFEPLGSVETANVISDKGSGRSKGFGFVVMTNDAEAKAAIESLNGKTVDDRTLKVEEAKTPQRPATPAL